MVPGLQKTLSSKKKVQGPLQKSCIRRRYDCTGRSIYPSNIERHVIKKYVNSNGEVVKIYDNDKERTIDRVYNEYFVNVDIWDMWRIIEEGKVTKERYAEEFIKRIYEDITYDRIYHKVDTIY